MLSAYCEQREWDYEVIKDLGSGLNYNKRGLLKLLTLIVSGKVRRLVITHKDRLMRFGAELIFNLCEIFNTEVVIINRTIATSPEEDSSARRFRNYNGFFCQTVWMCAVIKIKHWLTNCVKTAKRIQENSAPDTQTYV